MEFIKVDDETLAKMEKCAAQFSTAFRTFSKLIVSLRKNGSESSDYGGTMGETEDEKSECSEPSEDAPEPDFKSWLFSKDCPWGPYHATDVADFLISNYRGDRNKSFWKMRSGDDPNNRKSWKKIAETSVVMLYSTYTDLLRQSKLFAAAEKVANSELWQSVHGCKKTRIFRLSGPLNRPISYTKFVKIMRDRHDSLPALRRL